MKSFPTAHTVLLIVVILATLLTWVVPAGKYDRIGYDKNAKVFKVEGTNNQELPATQSTLDSLNIKIPLEKFTSGAIYKPIAMPAGYHPQNANPQGFFEFAKAPIEGIGGAFDVILFVLIIGGFIGVIHHTGAFDLGVASLASALRGRELLLIVVITSLIALGGTTFGLAEETIAFYPILMPVFLAAGYDALVAVACIYIGSCVGTMVSTVNPFSVIIASDAAGVNWTSGFEGRVAMLIVCLAVSIFFIIRYAEKVRKDPSKSLIFSQKEAIEAIFLPKQNTEAIHMADNDSGNVTEMNTVGGEEKKWNLRTLLALAVFVTSLVLLIKDVYSWHWWIPEMRTIFFGVTTVVAFLDMILDPEEKEKLKIPFVLAIFVASFVLMITGVSSWHWWFTEMTTIFFVAAIVVAFVASIREKTFIEAFMKGSGDLLSVAFTIGLARAVNIVMDNGMITDTLLHASSGMVEGMSKGVFANAMLFLYGGLSFFIPSSSGMAVLTMPIMAPLADVVGTSRELVVNCYQYGMGIMAIITPTGLVLASLTMVDVSYSKWLRFIMPLVVVLTLLAMVAVTLEVYL